MATYQAGNLVEVQATFVQSSTSDTIDPSTITLYYGLNLLEPNVAVYGDDDGFITRQSQGVYTALLDTTIVDGVGAGIWTYQWVGTGEVGQSVQSNTFVVVAPPFTLDT